ncbi:MAG: arylesterase [Rhodothermales bacterium]
MIRPLIAFMLLFALLPGCSSSPDPAPAEAPAATAAPESTPSSDDALTIVYLGDSLTAGYGLAGGEDQAYPALIAAKVEALGWNVRTVNAGLSGDTSAGGLRRLEWLASRQDIDVLVLALGANDGLRGLPVEAMRENLEAIIARARAANPDVRIVLAGMMVPTNMGGAYGERFNGVFRAVAAEQDVALIPFLLDGVGGVRALNQPDGVHPTAEGQRIMAETVWATLRPVLEVARAERS